MIIKNSYLFSLFIILNSSCSTSNTSEPSNSDPDPAPIPTPTIPVAMEIADPTILKSEDTYYLYGTYEQNTNLGFPVYTSTNLKDWIAPKGSNNGFALAQGNAYGTSGFWAPQVFNKNGNFYIFYTANEKIAMAISNSALGSFSNINNSTIPSDKKIIDPFVFLDDNGKNYLYHVRLEDGNKIYVVELNDDMISVKSETLKECIAATDSWENTQNASWPVAEGPTVFKYNDLYYMLYSANDFRNIDYAIGFATSSSPLGPWTKSNKNPIINNTLLGINGTGHGDIFMDNEQMYYVFHTHKSNTIVTPRRTALIKLNFVSDENNPDYLSADKSSLSLLDYKSK